MFRRDIFDCEGVDRGLDVGGAACKGWGALTRSLGKVALEYDGVYDGAG